MLSLVIAATLIAASNAQTCNYNSICTDHTMCLYPTEDYAAHCLDPVYSGINATIQQQIVDLHNKVRRRVAKGLENRGNPGPQPNASNMRKLTWDDELATIAQRWSNQCRSYQDVCRGVDRFQVGQNMVGYTISGPTLFEPPDRQEWTIVLNSLSNQVQWYSHGAVVSFRCTNTTHSTEGYTQMVWADTYKVGCGFTAYRANEYMYSKVHVCNYGPVGNIVSPNSRLYRGGPPCSQCPTSAPNCDDGLCA